MESQPFGFAHMLAALDFFLQKPKEIVVVGRREEPAVLDLLKKVHSLYLPNHTLQQVSPEEPLDSISPLLQGKGQIDGKATVYVCHNFTCSRPVTAWEDLLALLARQ